MPPKAPIRSQRPSITVTRAIEVAAFARPVVLVVMAVTAAEPRRMLQRSGYGESRSQRGSSVHQHEAGDGQRSQGEQKGEFRFHGWSGVYCLALRATSSAALLYAAVSSTGSKAEYSIQVPDIFLHRLGSSPPLAEAAVRPSMTRLVISSWQAGKVYPSDLEGFDDLRSLAFELPNIWQE